MVPLRLRLTNVDIRQQSHLPIPISTGYLNWKNLSSNWTLKRWFSSSGEHTDTLLNASRDCPTGIWAAFGCCAPQTLVEMCIFKSVITKLFLFKQGRKSYFTFFEVKAPKPSELPSSLCTYKLQFMKELEPRLFPCRSTCMAQLACHTFSKLNAIQTWHMWKGELASIIKKIVFFWSFRNKNSEMKMLTFDHKYWRF